MVDYEYKGPVLFVDDEMHIRLSAKQTLELSGFDVICLENAKDALDQLKQGWNGIVISDIKMPSMDGLEFLAEARKIAPDIPIILITGHGDVSMAVKAMREGAYDFIEKPFAAEILSDTASRAMERFKLVRENQLLREKLRSRSDINDQILGRSSAIENLRQLVANVADTDTDILIQGETGTGKELVARCLHENSARSNAHFVAVNCGAMPENIFESELFGYEPGAFPGNPNRRIGKIEYSSGGTLFLDEVEALPMAMQVKLLRVLQERSIERLGSNVSLPLNLRIVCAAKRDLLSLIEEGSFREDLYYRLNVMVIPTPPLRQCKEDLSLLFNHFSQLASERLSRPIIEASDGLIQSLLAHSWPGNVRELKNAAERFVLSNGKSPLHTQAMVHEDTSQTLPEKMDLYEKSLIIKAMDETGGNIKETMEILGLPRKTLSDKLTKHQINRQDFLD
jgi:two-component system C4-dicarboxylate transport response regulator DctD